MMPAAMLGLAPMRGLRRVEGGLWLSVVASCASETVRPVSGEGVANTPVAMESPSAATEAATPSASATPQSAGTSAAAASASPTPAAQSTAMSAASALDPSASEPAPPPPLHIPRATACTDAENERSWCARGGRTGECIEGTCITPATCPAYCAAVAARENDCREPLDAECAKVPACVRATKNLQDLCKVQRQQTDEFCRSVTCERIRAMPRPPMPDSRD